MLILLEDPKGLGLVKAVSVWSLLILKINVTTVTCFSFFFFFCIE